MPSQIKQDIVALAVATSLLIAQGSAVSIQYSTTRIVDVIAFRQDRMIATLDGTIAGEEHQPLGRDLETSLSRYAGQLRADTENFMFLIPYYVPVKHALGGYQQPIELKGYGPG